LRSRGFEPLCGTSGTVWPGTSACSDANTPCAGDLRVNAGELNATQFAILDELPSLKDPDQPSKWKFRLRWVGDSRFTGENIWRQSSNPTTWVEAAFGQGLKVTGYEAIQVAYNTSNNWGGLEAGGYSLMDGSADHGNFYYSLGTTSTYPNLYGPTDEQMPPWNCMRGQTLRRHHRRRSRHRRSRHQATAVRAHYGLNAGQTAWC
jgi:hypothetical protein